MQTHMREALKKCRNGYALFRLRLGRGRGYFEDLKYVAMLTVTLKIYDIDIASALPIALFMIIFFYLVGYCDENYFGIWKYEAAYSSKQLNPVVERMYDNIEELKKRGEMHE